MSIPQLFAVGVGIFHEIHQYFWYAGVGNRFELFMRFNSINTSHFIFNTSIHFTGKIYFTVLCVSSYHDLYP